MQLVPTHDEVVALLRRTGGLREGHFEYTNGLHANEYLQVALTMRYYEANKILSVALSRLLRAHSDIRAMIPELSKVCARAPALQLVWDKLGFNWKPPVDLDVAYSVMGLAPK